MDQENNIDDLPVHNINNKGILKDAKMPNNIIEIGGKSYFKVRLWVHELERLTGENTDEWGEINVDFLTDERIQLLEAKVKKLASINHDLQQYNHNQVYELNCKTNLLKLEISNLRQSEKEKNLNLKSQNADLKAHNYELENKIKNLKIQLEDLSYKNDDLIWEIQNANQKLYLANSQKDHLLIQKNDLTVEIKNYTDKQLQLSFLNDSLKLENNKFKIDLDELRQQSESLSREYEIAKKQLKNLTFELSVKENLIKETTREYFSKAYRQKTSDFLTTQKEKADIQYKEFLDKINQKKRHHQNTSKRDRNSKVSAKYSR